MSNYCTVQDVRNALTPKGLAADDTEQGKTAATMPDWQIIDAIVEAETIINAYVKRRYKIENEDVEEPKIKVDGTGPEDPLVLITANVALQPIRSWTRTIAAYYATLTFREAKDLEERDPIILRYNSVMQMLSGVRTGTFDLDLPPLDDADVDDGVEIFNIYDGDMFQLGDLGLAPSGSGNAQRYIPVSPWP